MNLFNKYPHPVNFNFADSYHGGVVTIAGHPFELHTAEAGADIYHVVVSHHRCGPATVATKGSGGWTAMKLRVSAAHDLKFPNRQACG